MSCSNPIALDRSARTKPVVPPRGFNLFNGRLPIACAANSYHYLCARMCEQHSRGTMGKTAS